MTAFQLAVSASLKTELNNEATTFPNAAFWIVFADAWSFLSIEAPKLGIGLMACRLFIPRRAVKWTVLGFCIALNLLAIVGVVITYVQCSPVQSQFNPAKYPGAKCWNRAIQLIFACTLSGECSSWLH